jgi:hypothetical protein
MKPRWSLVLLASLLAGLFMSVTGMLGMMPRFFYDVGDTILLPVWELLGASAEWAHAVVALIFCFLTGFVPVFLIGSVSVLLRGGSQQGMSNKAERPE